MTGSTRPARRDRRLGDRGRGSGRGPVFAQRVLDGMQRKGVGLRELCRGVGLDPSFFSKVLSGKRSPPAEEEALRGIAGFLGLDSVELIVSAGRIPGEWRALADDEDLLRSAHSLITGERSSSEPAWGRASRQASERSIVRKPPMLDPRHRRGGLAEELL